MKSLEEVAKIKSLAVTEKENLEKQKKSSKDWNDKKQEELDEVVVFIVDLEEYIDDRKSKEGSNQTEKEAEKPERKVAEGTEKLVQVSLIRGRRYDPATGKLLSKPSTQMFTYSEWQLFKKNFKGLGYTITAVHNDPYGDAAALVTKAEKAE